MTMNDKLIGNANQNEQSYISELRDAYENSVRAITSTDIWFSLLYSGSYCDADICGLLKERDSLHSHLAEKDAEIKRLGDALRGLGYTSSADEDGQEEDSGSYDSLIPEKSWVGKSAQTIKFIKENRANEDRIYP
jgi:hypothetical protein